MKWRIKDAQVSVWPSLLLTTAATFAVFFFTLCPTVFVGDSGELTAVARFMGVTHPPGYPLFVLWGRIFAMLPGMEPAYFTNLLSAVATVFAVGFVFVCLRRLTGSVVSAVAGAWVFGFSKFVWGNATITEVYALVACGVTIMCVLLERVDAKPKHPGQLYILAYVMGMLLVLHQSLVLFLPVVVYVVFCSRRCGRLPLAVLSLALGVTPYAVLMVRSPLAELTWGPVSSMPDLLAWLLRRNYGALAQNPLSIEIVLGNLQGFFGLLVENFSVAALIFAPFGLLWLSKHRPRFAHVTVVAFCSFLIGVIVLIRPYPDHVHFYQLESIYMPLYCVVALWIGVGLHAITKVGHRALNMVSPIVLLIPLFILYSNWTSNDRHSDFDAKVYGENLLRSVPQSGVLIVDGDNESFVTAYLTRVLGLRPDVTVFHRRGFLFDAPAEIKYAARDVRRSRSQQWERRILANYDNVCYATFADLSHVPEWKLVRRGIAYAAVARDSEQKRCSGNVALLRSYDMSTLARVPQQMDFLERKLALGYLQALYEAEHVGVRSAALLARLVAMGFDVAEAHYFAGVELERSGDLEAAYDAFVRAAYLSPQTTTTWQRLAHIQSLIVPRSDALLRERTLN